MTISPLPFTEETLKPSQLFVDPRIQRELVSRQIDSMTGDNYRSESVGMLVVSKRPGGRYAILDGQHRWTVISAQDPDRDLQCQVFSNLTEEQEAELFLLYNNQSTVNAVAKFKAGVIAGRPLPLAVMGILDEYGLEVGNGFHHFNAVYTAMRIATWRDGLKLLDGAVDILTQAWSPMVREDGRNSGLEFARTNAPWRGSTVEGMCRLLHRYGSAVHTARMVDQLVALGSRGPQRIANDAATVKSSMGRMLASEATAMVLVRIYNNGRGGSKLDRWEVAVDEDLGGLSGTATLNDLMFQDVPTA